MKNTSTLERRIWAALNKVMDPEMYVSIVELGLVYDLKLDEHKKAVIITMTLTSLGCPLYPVIERQIQQEVKRIRAISEVSINLTFDPPWTFDRMSEAAKAQLGIG